MLWFFLLFVHLQLVNCCGPGEYLILGLCCPTCPVGSRVSKHCTAETNTGCRACTHGEYIDHPSGLEKCLKCESCDSGMGLLDAQQCTYFQNSICHCKEGYFCVERKWRGCETCRKHSLGPVGEGVKKKGTIWEDYVYETCPHGTYSDNVSTEECKPWTKCKELNKLVVRPGNASMDAECKEKINIAHILLIVIPVMTVAIGGVLGILYWKRRAVRKHTDGCWTHTDADQARKYCHPSDTQCPTSGPSVPPPTASDPLMAVSGTEANDVDKTRLGNNQKEENVNLSIQISNERHDSGIGSSDTSPRTNLENIEEGAANT
ncbi:tumor necrosis factor receptor superfamily member 14-like [Callorhinchus milii]|uniref:tumor necrosis factor receptor superfamily member 14-like n=1 Tax=Callorhinchus milii TaxID=7868 RepID=UPI001C3F5579|nr:tumor necrosis factor receptor superfamily member 14-like [Callorhinchus milii]XP_042199692.1 tumor necrosis factor receptor superfamily member 14-like [Callorhinchus milii]XP_042199693.1 tumor necrosis factor receptor superfamily member 14-like [Callorhinchus milii]